MAVFFESSTSLQMRQPSVLPESCTSSSDVSELSTNSSAAVLEEENACRKICKWLCCFVQLFCDEVAY